ncbi:MAG: D,D-heptose 1,7-bisphosphate phosphatase [Rhizobiales bacterium 35-66-30]|nr:MAG: D,D-heptose 1,7-bisphosphate phosphatase [Rhizobiales bacterium 35-66-30]
MGEESGAGAQALRPAAFLDRDGVLNVDIGYAFRPADLRLTPGAGEAVARLNAAGYLVFVVTNQSGIARGLYTLEQAQAFNAALALALSRAGGHVDRFYLAPHHPDGSVAEYALDHFDRKPNPGMILRALEEWPVDRARSFLIGDKETDMEAARRAALPGHLYAGGNLDDLVRDIIRGT